MCPMFDYIFLGFVQVIVIESHIDKCTLILFRKIVACEKILADKVISVSDR